MKDIDQLIHEHKQELEVYYNLLIKWGATYNLTSIKDKDEVFEKHFWDSLAVMPFLPTHGRLLDIGAGAGFPGIPLKMASPALSVMLLEATKKKCNFCDAVIRELGLKDIKMVQGRVEENSTMDKCGKFDIVISRATFSLKDYLGYAKPYIKDAGSMIVAMKSGDIEEELKEASAELKELDIKIERYSLPSGAKRSVLIFRPRSAK